MVKQLNYHWQPSTLFATNNSVSGHRLANFLGFVEYFGICGIFWDMRNILGFVEYFGICGNFRDLWNIWIVEMGLSGNPNDFWYDIQYRVSSSLCTVQYVGIGSF